MFFSCFLGYWVFYGFLFFVVSGFLFVVSGCLFVVLGVFGCCFFLGVGFKSTHGTNICGFF